MINMHSNNFQLLKSNDNFGYKSLKSGGWVKQDLKDKMKPVVDCSFDKYKQKVLEDAFEFLDVGVCKL